MRKTSSAAIAVAFLAVLSSFTAAHHNPAMLYDLSHEIEVEGTVTEFVLGNPHLRIYFEVERDGETTQWMAEGGSRTVLVRMGWDGNEVEPGDRITVRGHPSRDGSPVVHLQYLVMPDGSEKFGEDLNEAALNSRSRRTRAR
jgi:phenylpropionate dioxygenase-like ring-hydroxylating dioxygenase large terminal subunit